MRIRSLRDIIGCVDLDELYKTNIFQRIRNIRCYLNTDKINVLDTGSSEEATVNFIVCKTNTFASATSAFGQGL